MRIKINEKYIEIFEGVSCFQLRDEVKSGAEIIILNGFPIKEDILLKDGDCISFIRKGEMPNKEELESLIVARHTPMVYEKVKKVSIGIAGAGGLGSNVALSLARIGVNNIKIVDFDIVEPSNLNRQQYYIKDIGEYKVIALKRNLKEVNPFINITGIIEKLNKNNIKEIFNDVDIIIEAFDNPECKAELSRIVLSEMKDKVLIASSGMASYYPSNDIITRKINSRFYICGDGVNEAKEGNGLMAPRVAICANHMANCALRIILGEEGK
ncbi:sulfur carrier protein ThiS adenylyltransferase ThiF [Clostridium sp.]|uniref:sulfur carrier protein ThiS adenylyltransferase ThiF n=1 Tax=Clostridium sp. TaxID=1506 RepID=UPI003522E643